MRFLRLSVTKTNGLGPLAVSCLQVRSSVWNYRGYDLIYKLCGCLCGHGHVRKLLEAEQPEEAAQQPEPREERKKKKSANLKPKLNTAVEGVDKTRTRRAERGGEEPGEEGARVPGSFWNRGNYLAIFVF